MGAGVLGMEGYGRRGKGREREGRNESGPDHVLEEIGSVALMLQCCARPSVCLSSSVCNACFVAKRCVLEQNLLLIAYRN